MDQQVDNKIELKDKIVSFFKKNKKNYCFNNFYSAANHINFCI